MNSVIEHLLDLPTFKPFKDINPADEIAWDKREQDLHTALEEFYKNAVSQSGFVYCMLVFNNLIPFASHLENDLKWLYKVAPVHAKANLVEALIIQAYKGDIEAAKTVLRYLEQ